MQYSIDSENSILIVPLFKNTAEPIGCRGIHLSCDTYIFIIKPDLKDIVIILIFYKRIYFQNLSHPQYS